MQVEVYIDSDEWLNDDQQGLFGVQLQSKIKGGDITLTLCYAPHGQAPGDSVVVSHMSASTAIGALVEPNAHSFTRVRLDADQVLWFDGGASANGVKVQFEREDWDERIKGSTGSTGPQS